MAVLGTLVVARHDDDDIQVRVWSSVTANTRAVDDEPA